MARYPEYVHPNSAFRSTALSPDLGKTWNKCHMQDNFMISDATFFRYGLLQWSYSDLFDRLRSKEYRDFFEFLDRDAVNGMFMHRWGDSPILNLAVAIMRDRKEMHLFTDMGYSHDGSAPIMTCPRNETVRLIFFPKDARYIIWSRCRFTRCMTALAKGRKSPIPSSRSIRLVERHGSMLDSIKSHSSINLIIFSWHMIWNANSGKTGDGQSKTEHE